MADLVKHSELTVEQVTHIQKDLLVGLRKKGQFWDSFCSHTSIPAGTDTISWRKLNVPELLPSQVQALTEGVTPAGLALTYVKFSVQPADYGDWIGYTDASKRYNYDDVVADAKLVLGQRARELVEIKKAQQFIGGTCTISLTTSGDDAFLKDLLKARTILKKNHALPIRNGKYGCILTPEQAADVLVTYKEAITHTKENEAILNGYIGELGGFMLFECADEIMYKRTTASGSGEEAVSAKTEGYCLFIGKTEYGMPVQTVAFGDDSVAVYDNGLGSIPQYDSTNGLRPDALHQRGSVGFKIMGFATRILADEAILRAEYTISSSSATGDWKQSIDDDDRQHYSAASTSPDND